MTSNFLSAGDIVKLARKQDRFTSLDYFNAIFDDFIEFHGDRLFSDDKAVVGGIARLGNQPVTLVGIQKGRFLPENIERNFGSPHPDGYRKALRLMKQAEKFGRPVITFINTPGAFCGIEAEERGEGEAIARNLYEMSDLKVPIISIIIGEAGSGGALALAVANEVWMLEHAMYSILSPEGFASILWKDSSRSDDAAEVMKLTANDLLQLHVIDKIIPEVFNNESLLQTQINLNIKKSLEKELSKLIQLSSEEIVEQRQNRFRQY